VGETFFGLIQQNASTDHDEEFDIRCSWRWIANAWHSKICNEIAPICGPVGVQKLSSDDARTMKRKEWQRPESCYTNATGRLAYLQLKG
jgi:hypothetical protein